MRLWIPEQVLLEIARCSGVPTWCRKGQAPHALAKRAGKRNVLAEGCHISQRRGAQQTAYAPK